MQPMTDSWTDEAKVREYTGRVGRLAARRAGEMELVEALPAEVERVLDLGCGDGRLISLVLDARPGVPYLSLIHRALACRRYEDAVASICGGAGVATALVLDRA